MDILETITEINRHIAVLNDDYSRMSANVAVLQNQMASMVWWTRSIGIAFIGLLITQGWQLLLMKKNGKVK